MIKAKATMKDGRVALVLGLSAGNVERLEAGQPIYFDIGALKMSESDRLGAVTIFYGVDDAALSRNLKPFIGPDMPAIPGERGGVVGIGADDGRDGLRADDGIGAARSDALRYVADVFNVTETDVWTREEVRDYLLRRSLQGTDEG